MSKLVKELDILKEKKEKDFNGDHIVKQAEVLLLDSHNQDNVVLETLGLDHQIKYTKKLEIDYRRGKIAEETYNKKSYSGSDIKTLCNDYDLKMLPTSYYNGEIPSDLARIVSEFCESNNISMRPDCFYILAPTEMFRTVKHVPRNLDPILFYKEPNSTSSRVEKAHKDDSFVNIHYWGNDFSPLRKFRYLFSDFKEYNSDWPNRNRMIVFIIVFSLLAIANALLFYIPMAINVIILAILTSLTVGYSSYYKSKYLNDLWNDKKI